MGGKDSNDVIFEVIARWRRVVGGGGIVTQLILEFLKVDTKAETENDC